MTELGQRLKDARNDKGLSLEEIQSITKIQKRYLHAIEEGNYELLPGNFYTRAFIKNYAEAVGLHGDELLEEYASEIPKANADVPESLPPRKMRRPQAPSKSSSVSSKWSSVFPSVLVVLLIVGVAALIWYVVQSGDQKTNQNATTNQAEEQVTSDENSGSAPDSDEVSNEGDASKEATTSEEEATSKEDEKAEEEKAAEEEKEPEEEEAPKMEIKKVKSDTDNSTFEITNADKFEVKLEASGSSWVGLTGASDKKYVYESLAKGKSVTQDLSKESSATLRLGSSPSIEVFVNGEKIDIPKEPVVQNVTFTFEKAE
ncbi:helix-turn-helix domain-containing protein [Bacillus sp. es.036]|uniref:helix-turn-helix domain-containing protein n=1 Tax=Bacillus sp. es.036 TaxID=1761764 RepID=UPI000BF563BE|nr:RodZ domain-containing protein [Bacillus sp. es.036]PFG13007.1 cytoskeletal protein RodZ [Bacillus sp. es.036]